MQMVKEYPEFGADVFRALSRKLDTSMDDLGGARVAFDRARSCPLYTSDAADDLHCVDLGGPRCLQHKYSHITSPYDL